MKMAKKQGAQVNNNDDADDIKKFCYITYTQALAGYGGLPSKNNVQKHQHINHYDKLHKAYARMFFLNRLVVGGVLVDAFSLMPMFIVRCSLAMCTMTSLLPGFFSVHREHCVFRNIICPHIKIRYAPQKCDGDSVLSPPRNMNWIRTNLAYNIRAFVQIRIRKYY